MVLGAITEADGQGSDVARVSKHIVAAGFGAPTDRLWSGHVSLIQSNLEFGFWVLFVSQILHGCDADLTTRLSNSCLKPPRLKPAPRDLVQSWPPDSLRRPSAFKLHSHLASLRLRMPITD